MLSRITDLFLFLQGGPTLKTLTTELVLWQKEWALRRSAKANGNGMLPN